MYNKFKKLARRVLEWMRLHNETWKDSNRYYTAASWAGPVKGHGLEHIEADLIRHYHVVEKGLAMPDFRPKAGEAVVRRLVELVREWELSDGDANSRQYRAAIDTLFSYRERHQEIGIDVTELIGEDLIHSEERDKCSILGGVKARSKMQESDRDSFDRIMRDRHSVRVFKKGEEPTDDELRSAIESSITTPSVCNRQTWRVHIYRGEEGQRVLKCQNGNRGFGHTIPVVMLVTVDMRYFSEVAERFQPWIEGGLFSMSLMLALHARGIGNVPLNWSRNNADDAMLRDVAALEPYERVIMMIGCGYAEDEAMVPISCRNDVDWFIRWHGEKSN